MWRTLLETPFPEAASTLPPEIQGRAEHAARVYWRTRGWQLVLGEFVLWGAAIYRTSPHAGFYVAPAVIIGAAYLLVFQPSTVLWLMGTLVLFGVQGSMVSGMGAVTALAYMIPYTIAGMSLPRRKRLFVQMSCVLAFWGSLLYEIVPVLPQLDPTSYIIVSYNILIAAYTFQTLRYLNHLAVDINSEHVTAEVRLQSHQFLARVSHELRTPLNSMLGFGKLLCRADLTERHQDYLNHVIDEGEHLNRLVSDLLDSAHLSTGKLTLNREDCDVNALCQAVAEENRPTLPDGVAMVTDLAPDMPHTQADPMRLRQAIGNLVTNAVKHTAAGTITLRTRHTANTLTIDVADTGAGINEEQQRLIFVPFVQLDTRSAGVGLGLDIALQLVRLHGGTIHLNSTMGKGSTFTIKLPHTPP